jgi:hypothetical protein
VKDSRNSRPEIVGELTSLGLTPRPPQDARLQRSNLTQANQASSFLRQTPLLKAWAASALRYPGEPGTGARSLIGNTRIIYHDTAGRSAIKSPPCRRHRPTRPDWPDNAPKALSSSRWPGLPLQDLYLHGPMLPRLPSHGSSQSLSNLLAPAAFSASGRLMTQCCESAGWCRKYHSSNAFL